MKCAITGANGLVGSFCTRWLNNLGYHTIRFQRQIQDDDTRQFDLHGCFDEEVLRDIDALVHCAYDFGARDWRTIRKINVDGSIQLLRAAREASVSKIVYISSVSAYEGCKSLYGKGKLEVETVALDLGAVVVRPGLVFGSFQHGMLGALNRMTAFSVLPVFDGGLQPMVLVHGDDLARFVGAILEEWCTETEPLIAARSDYVTFKDILIELARRRGKSLSFISIPSSVSLVAMRIVERFGLHLPFSSDSLVSLLNPAPDIDFSATDRYGVRFRSFFS